MGKVQTAWSVQPYTEHTVTQLVARPSWLDSDGEWLYASDRWSNPLRELDGFVVHAYLRRGESGWELGNARPLFGDGMVNVDYASAERMVKVMRRVRRGLDKANAVQGYLNGGAKFDYAPFVARVGAVLGISQYRTLNSAKRRQMSGERFTLTDAAGLQSWVPRVLSGDIEMGA